MQHCFKSPALLVPSASCNQPRCPASLLHTSGQWQNQRWQSAEAAPVQMLEARRSQAVCARAVDTKAPEAESASTNTSDGASSEPSEQFYEVTLKKPLGLTLARGNDGGTYVQSTDPKAGNTDERIQPGDKVLQVSASFGSDVWDARNFGQVLYAIKTRNGDVFLKFLNRQGDVSILQEQDVDESQAKYLNERDGGNYGYSTKQWQISNYKAKKESEAKRIELFEGALSKFKKSDIEGALIDFEEVISLEPKNFMGEDFSRVTQVYRVAQYNIACCYSAINQAVEFMLDRLGGPQPLSPDVVQVDAGLEALRAAMSAGFEQYGKIRSDANLDNLRKSPKFKPLVDEFDEPVISEGAIKAIKNLFSFGKQS